MYNEQSYLYLVFELINRGISTDDISQAMKKIIGADWREVRVPVWIGRLKEKGYLSQDTAELSADDLEALVKASITLDRL